ncbi:Rne/Rng family ribonuclease [Thioclava sp. GXIMD4216]|uniref:Rne/Rng family ribonuclease n=1 Tax=Thioclava sp. GXIMD4216 TaxID=3131929 RepID=UPI0030D49FA6
MAKKMLIDATHAEETRVVVVDGNKVEEFDFETINKRQLAGNIYLAKVTRVEPSLQAAFVDYGGNRHGFLAFAEIHPDYYQIPTADREALLAEERALAQSDEDEEEKPARTRRRRRSSRSDAAETQPAQAEATAADETLRSEDIPGMGVADPSEDNLHIEDHDTPQSDDAPHDAADEQEDDHGSESDHDDDDIESVAEEDVSEEIRRPRKPRARRFKIQEVIKVRQIMLVQVVKEERGNKGAALTTYLSLAGRYCVLMPNTARGGGISRKITNAADRKKLKDIASELSVPQGAGLIIRTAGSQRTKTEIRRDYEYLIRMWQQIRELTMKSVAPAPIYEEGDLIKRSIRDLYSKDIDEVLVEGERGYRAAKDFMRMIMPSHAKNVQHYAEALPLFARYQVEGYLASMFNPVVQLKSGGYLVIGVTEALVAIDVNSGRATKEGSIEETALKTNLEAADEVARQVRLRDLAGLIVIDFIDMDERKNNTAVEKRMKDKLKTDRARIQVGRISGFGLMEMSRQRLRPGMIESTTQPCPHCHGTGLIRSDDSMALQVLRAIEEEATRKRAREVLVRVPVAVANFLINQKREHIALIESRYGLSVRIEADPTLVSPDYVIEKFKTATRVVPEAVSNVVHASAEFMSELEELDAALDAEIVEEDEDEAPEAATETSTDEGPKKKKRRRRRRRKSGADQLNDEAETESDEEDSAPAAEAEPDVAAEDAEGEATAPEAAEEAPKPKRSRSRSRRKPKAEAETNAEAGDNAADTTAEAEAAPEATAEAEDAPKPKRSRSRARRSKKDETLAVEAEVEAVAAPASGTVVDTAPAAEAVASVPEADAGLAEIASPAAPVAEAPAAEAPVAEAAVGEVITAQAPVAERAKESTAEPEAAQAEADNAPKRRGWWNVGN